MSSNIPRARGSNAPTRPPNALATGPARGRPGPSHTLDNGPKGRVTIKRISSDEVQVEKLELGNWRNLRTCLVPLSQNLQRNAINTIVHLPKHLEQVWEPGTSQRFGCRAQVDQVVMGIMILRRWVDPSELPDHLPASGQVGGAAAQNRPPSQPPRAPNTSPAPSAGTAAVPTRTRTPNMSSYIQRAWLTCTAAGNGTFTVDKGKVRFVAAEDWGQWIVPSNKTDLLRIVPASIGRDNITDLPGSYRNARQGSITTIRVVFKVGQAEGQALRINEILFVCGVRPG